MARCFLTILLLLPLMLTFSQTRSEASSVQHLPPSFVLPILPCPQRTSALIRFEEVANKASILRPIPDGTRSAFDRGGQGPGSVLRPRFPQFPDRTGGQQVFRMTAEEAGPAVATIPAQASGTGLCVLPNERGEHVVTAVAPYTAAKQNGAQPGDRLISIDGLKLDDLPVTDVIQLLIGEEGTSVVLLLEASNGNQKMMTIQRKPTLPRSPQNATLYSRLAPALCIMKDWAKAMQDLEGDMSSAMKASDFSAASAFSVEIGDVLEAAGEDVSKSLVKYQEGVDLARAAQDAKGEVAAFEKFAQAMRRRTGGLSEQGQRKLTKTAEAEWRPKGFVEGKKTLMLRKVRRLRRMRRKTGDSQLVPKEGAARSVMAVVRGESESLAGALPEGAQRLETGGADLTLRLDCGLGAEEVQAEARLGGGESVAGSEEGHSGESVALEWEETVAGRRLRGLLAWFESKVVAGDGVAGGVWMEVTGLNSTIRRELHMECEERGLASRSWGAVQRRRILIAGDELTVQARMASPDRKAENEGDFASRQRRARRRRNARARRAAEGGDEAAERAGGVGFGLERLRELGVGGARRSGAGEAAFDLESFKFLDVASWRELLREWQVPMLPQTGPHLRVVYGPPHRPVRPLASNEQAGKLSNIPRRTLR